MVSKPRLFGRRSRVAGENQDDADVEGAECAGGAGGDTAAEDNVDMADGDRTDDDSDSDRIDGTRAEGDGDAAEGAQPATPPAEAGGRAKRQKKPRKPRPTVWQQTGGLVGLFISSFPVTVFSLVQTRWGLKAGIASAMATAVVFGIVRLIMKLSVQPAISGFIGIAISSSVAYSTGTAKGYFLFDIWFYLCCLTFTLMTILIRRPLAGLLWSSMNRQSVLWRKDKKSVHAYDIATVAWAMVFGSRFVVQHWLYEKDLTGWLAVAKISMGFPLTLVACAAVIWAVRRSDKRLKFLEAQEEQRQVELEAGAGAGADAQAGAEPGAESGSGPDQKDQDQEGQGQGQEQDQDQGQGQGQGQEQEQEQEGRDQSGQPPRSAEPVAPSQDTEPAVREKGAGRAGRLKPTGGKRGAPLLNSNSPSVPGEVV